VSERRLRAVGSMVVRRRVRGLLGMVILLVAAELALRAFIVAGRSATPALVANSLDANAPLTSDAWGYRFLRNHAEGQGLVEQSLYRVHPTRGWALNPNVAVWVDENLYTTNAYGHRGPDTPAKETTKTKVMVLGDSQTFGEEVDDWFTWPNILARERPDLEIINLAVSGYGVDQMYVTFREELDVWKPDVVVLSPVRDDFYRASLWFRDYSKPWFEPGTAADGAVELAEHPPIADVDAALRMLDGMPGVRLRASRLVNLFLAAHDTVRIVPANWRQAHVVTTELVRRMRDRCREQKIPLVFALIGNFRGASNADDANDPGERVFRDTCATLAGPGFSCPDWREIPIHPGLSWQGHYKRLGNEMIAELVQRGLAPYVKQPGP